MSEGNLWDQLCPLMKPFGRAVRIENPADPGTPDVYWRFVTPVCVSGWLELKYIEEPKDLRSPIKIRHFTKEQITWLEAESEYGGRAHLLLQMGRTYHLFDVPAARLLYEHRVTPVLLRNSGLAKHLERLRLCPTMLAR